MRTVAKNEFPRTNFQEPIPTGFRIWNLVLGSWILGCGRLRTASFGNVHSDKALSSSHSAPPSARQRQLARRVEFFEKNALFCTWGRQLAEGVRRGKWPPGQLPTPVARRLARRKRLVRPILQPEIVASWPCGVVAKRLPSILCLTHLGGGHSTENGLHCAATHTQG
jgi:hypothetical protein